MSQDKIDLEKFLEIQQWQKWRELSIQGVVCGILGCADDAKSQCPICHNHYCYDHLKIHMHSLPVCKEQ